MDNNLIFGIRPVAEAIEAGKRIERLYIRKGADGQLMTELKDLCARHRIRFQEVPVEKLNRLTRGNHQGVVAQTAAIAYVELSDILERVPEDETPLVVLFEAFWRSRQGERTQRIRTGDRAHGKSHRTRLQSTAVQNGHARPPRRKNGRLFRYERTKRRRGLPLLFSQR